jgi:hypothetical protein
MKTLLAAVLATLLSAITLTAADPVSGTWQIHQNIVGNESDLACMFTQAGDDLAGTCDGPNGAVKLTGKVSGKKSHMDHPVRLQRYSPHSEIFRDVDIGYQDDRERKRGSVPGRRRVRCQPGEVERLLD